MAKCKHCGVDVGGGLFKPYNEGVVIERESFRKLVFCCDLCCARYFCEEYLSTLKQLDGDNTELIKTVEDEIREKYYSDEDELNV